MKGRIFGFIGLFGIIFFSCNQIDQQEFVKIKGTQFIIHNKPYYFVGVNMYFAAYLGATDEGQKRLIKELDLLKATGIDNIRILGASEASIAESALPVAIQTRPGEYNEELLKGLDFVLNEMGKRKMYAVIYLNNFWNWSGGMTQYLSWVINEPAIDPDKNQQWKEYMQQAAGFYQNEVAQNLYRKYISFLLNRKNTYTGVLYKNDPTIMAWQLANEPRPGADGINDSAQIEILARWVDTTAAFIKSIDTNHLVCTGSEGIVGCVQNINGYLKVHRSKYIDYANFHLWAKNWGWFDAKNPEQTFENTLTKAREYINLHISLARQLGKPITLEEYGMERDHGLFEPNSPTTYRDQYFDFILKLIADSATQGAPIAGSNLWAWGGYGKPHPKNKVVENPWAFLGDPLGEPQGLNSVYASDTSTINILNKYAKLMKLLMK